MKRLAVSALTGALCLGPPAGVSAGAAISPATATPTLSEERLAAGRQALAGGRFQEAETLFRQALASDPRNVAAYRGVAFALVSQMRRGAAAAELLRTGRRWLEEGETALAAEILEHAVELEPRRAEAQALLGRALALDRRYAAAETPLREALELGVRDRRTLLYLGSSLWETGRLEEAARVLRDARELYPREAAIHQQLGRLELWRGRYAEAAESLREAARLSGGAALDLQLDLARALDGAGELEPALAAFWRAVELAPRYSEVRYGLARLLAKSGDREGAERQLEIYRRLFEDEQEAVRSAGVEQAEVDFGYELVRLGEVERAIEHLTGLAATPDSLAALAAAYRAAADTEAAVSALERAVAMAPDRADLRASLVELRLAARSGS